MSTLSKLQMYTKMISI